MEMGVTEILTSRHKSQWEQLTTSSRAATFFHTYDWEEVLRVGCRDQNPLYWGFWHDGELVAVWPTSIVPAFGGKVLYSLPNSNSGIPVVKDGLNPWLLRELVSHIHAATRKLGVLHWSVDLEMLSPYSELASICGFEIVPSSSCTFSLNTALDVSSLWSGVSKKARNAVRKATKQGVEVRESYDSAELSEYYAIYKATMERHHRRPLDPEFFYQLYHILRRKKARLFLAIKEGKLVAGVILLLHNQKAHWWSGASLENSWKLSANDLLLWHAIEWASNHGIQSLDLGPTPSARSSGLNLFKRHFGGQRIDLYRLHLPINVFRNLLLITVVRNYRKLTDRGIIPGMLQSLLQRNLWFD